MANLVLSLAAELVSAHITNNKVPAEDLPKLIREVHRALINVGQAETSAPKVTPAVPVKKSVLNDHLVCLECGKPLSMLKRHLMSEHHLTPGQYRQKWVLPASYPIVAPAYAKVRSALAKKIGLGRKRSTMKAVRKSSRGS
jgi:predicted transcriptional regulator